MRLILVRLMLVLLFYLLLSIPSPAEESMIVAHRGASADAPENTIPSFELAWKQGADAIEGDFHLTKDGEIVCIHDEDTRKISDQILVVRESTLAELRELDVGAYRGEAFKDTRIPLISEVFATVPESKKIYVEIKCGAEIIDPLLQAIEKSELADEQIVIISFEDQVIEEIKARAPQYKAFWLCEFKNTWSGKLKPSLKKVLRTLDRIGADGLSSNTRIPDPHIKSVRDKDYEWHVWTVDSPKTARRAEASGAESITTNRPERMKEGLGEADAAGDADKSGSEIGR